MSTPNADFGRGRGHRPRGSTVSVRQGLRITSGLHAARQWSTDFAGKWKATESKIFVLTSLLQVMWEKDFFGLNLQIRKKPSKDHCRRKTTQELSEYEPRDINGPDACERITETSRYGDRRIRK